MSSKPKVLAIASLGAPPYVGGIENVVDTLLRSELRESFELEVFDTYRAPDASRTRLAKASYAVRLAYACRARVKETKPDVVHIHFCSKVDFWKSAICLRVARSCGAKTIFHLHGGLFADFFQSMSRAQQLLTKRIFRVPDRVIVLSSYWKDVLSKIAPPGRIRILNNPIDCERLSRGERTPNRDLPTVLLLGRVGRAKGHYDVLRALPLVVAKHPNVKVRFAGNEDEDGAMDTLKALAEEAGLAEHLEFLGPVSFDPKVELLRTSTMMVLPSHAENMPMSVLEGMAAGMPVISTRVGAIPEVLDEGRAGLLIQPGDWRALAESINRLLDDPCLAERLATVASARARDRWDTKRISKHLETIYREVLAA